MSVDLVTGATGFIGRHLARRLLAAGREVRLLCRPASASRLDPETRALAEVAPGDLRDEASLRAATRGVSRVFHCAGQVSDWGPEALFREVNVAGTERLLAAAAAERVARFVHLSSIAVFGLPSPPEFDDDSPYGAGRDPYSRTKIAGEAAALRAHRERGLPVTVLRPAVVYGPLSTWAEEPVAMIRRGKMFLLGGGRGTCHPCYVENLLDALLLAAEHPRAVGRAYIVADDDPLPFSAYFDHLARIVGAGPIRRSIPLPVARAAATALEAAARLRRAEARPLLTHAAIDIVCTPSRLSIRRIREELGYAPRYDVAAAMAELERWFRTRALPPLAPRRPA
ncbi:NAD-dependent epimerase/dehydratase family protein [Anaeromyxobacter paludicola]|uniref:Oxidoreductase n=1 Tax=Anaeromyxobacter paludicola TaxID=2918171 RepID=A0ABN6N273_9BACT|nr:NAD-dependent epimerase/dehydratase family protein [Anaeromyxobacter paludicola]BDG07302.1 oxidoreductase [Anaeromyxobacter paludicola]